MLTGVKVFCIMLVVSVVAVNGDVGRIMSDVCKSEYGNSANYVRIGDVNGCFYERDPMESDDFPVKDQK